MTTKRKDIGFKMGLSVSIDHYSIEKITEQESQLRFSRFSHIDGFNIANSILERVIREDLKSVSIRVEINGLIIYQYVMDGKNTDKWLTRKQNTVNACGHSSLYVVLKNELDNTYSHYEKNDKFAISGGGFPIIVGTKRIGSIVVSGLEHFQDHEIIVDALVDYLNVK